MLDFPPAENLFETKQNIWFNYFHALCKEQQKSLVLKKRKTNSINHANIPAFCLRKVKHKWRMLLLSWKDWNCGLLRYWNLLVREKGSGRHCACGRERAERSRMWIYIVLWSNIGISLANTWDGNIEKLNGMLNIFK